MILHGNITSKVLGIDSGLSLLIPEQVELSNPQTAYKVVYLFHGLHGDNHTWLNNATLSNYAKDYPVIFVMPEVGRSFYTDMKFGRDYFTYVSDELPTLCKKIFNISSAREDTAVIGCSMGGYGALKCALTKPEQYGFCGAISAATAMTPENFADMRKNREKSVTAKHFGMMMVNDLFAIFGPELEWRDDINSIVIARKAENAPHKPIIYSACGKSDFLHQFNKIFSDEMAQLDYDFTFEEWEGVHDWYFFDEALRRALKHFFAKK